MLLSLEMGLRRTRFNLMHLLARETPLPSCAHAPLVASHGQLDDVHTHGLVLWGVGVYI